MKQFLFFLLFVSLSSCMHIYFTEVQPEGATRLNTIPSELFGEWGDDNSGAIIDQDGIVSYSILKDSVTFEILDTVYERTPLSDTFQLYGIRKYYVLNYRQSDTPWELAVIEKKKDGDICIYTSIEAKIFARDRKLKFVNARFDNYARDTVVNSLNPDLPEDFTFQSATFSGQMSYRTIKRIAKEKNILSVLKADGTVYVPGDD